MLSLIIFSFFSLVFCAFAGPAYQPVSCFKATTTISSGTCPPPPGTTCGPTPECLHLSTVTVPPYDPACPTTYTSTSYKRCPRTCPTGCPTYVETITLPPSPTPQPPSPLIKQASSKRASSSSSCYTYTTVAPAPFCPNAKSPCFEVQCITFVTKTLPPHTASCPTTKVVTATPSCRTTCRGGCQKWTETVQAEPTI